MSEAYPLTPAAQAAEQALSEIYACIDGDPQSVDSVEGEAAEQLALQILTLIDILENE